MPAAPPTRNPFAGRALIIALSLAGMAAVAAAVWSIRSRPGGSSAASTDESAPQASSPVTLIVSGDTTGWIVPCGCTSNQSGGLPRRGTLVADERHRGTVLVADAGGAPGGVSPYHRLKFEAILRGELQMGIAAHNLGGPEAALGADVLRKIEKELEVPFVSANLRDATGKLVTAPCRIAAVDGPRIAFVGVLTPQKKPAGCRIDEPRDAVLRTLGQFHGQFDHAVVLAWLPEPELRELAQSLPEVDAVIGGPTGQSLAPELSGPTLVGSATNKGKFVVSITIPRGARRAAWSGTAIEVSDRFADAPSQIDNLQAFRRDLEIADFPASGTGLVPPLPGTVPAGFRIAGNQACEGCHAGEFSAWKNSNHAHAWSTLVAETAHVDPECQRCHTTGYALPGGFESMALSSGRTDVGCESCHGPSQAHVQQPKIRTPAAAREECRRCHDRENSPRFEFADYWAQIVHGPRAANEPRSHSPE